MIAPSDSRARLTSAARYPPAHRTGVGGHRSYPRLTLARSDSVGGTHERR